MHSLQDVFGAMSLRGVNISILLVPSLKLCQLEDMFARGRLAPGGSSQASK